MAELPELEIILGRLRSTAKRKLDSASLKFGRGGEPEEKANADLARLNGCRLADLARYGAYLFLEFDNLYLLCVNMAGDVDCQVIKGKGEIPENNRLLLRFQGSLQLVLSAGNIAARVHLLDETSDVDFLTKLGPDPLLDQNVPEHLAKSLPKRRGNIRNTLMQENFVPGIGPLWADEILFQSRIRPDRIVTSLNPDEREKLLANIPKVLERAVRCQAKPSLLPKTFLNRHRAEDMACPVCQQPLETLNISGKDSIYCPHCQI